ncbi:hypothetical protein NQZ68_031977 [Dissostichus eleginoides]|nr:hypothetical protein NQZ68_031977 [Dissostichus eleginoides]
MPAPASGTPPQIRDKPSPVPVVPPSASGPVIEELKRSSNPLAHKEVQLSPVLYRPTAATQKRFPASSQRWRLLCPTPPVTQTIVGLISPACTAKDPKNSPRKLESSLGQSTDTTDHRNPDHYRTESHYRSHCRTESMSHYPTVGPSPTIGPTVRPIPNVQHNPLRNISSTSTSRPLSSNLFIALRPGVSPGVRPGVSPGVSPGVRPGVRVVVSPGVCPGVTPVVRAVADSACDCSFQPVTARQEPAENEPTSTMSEEPEPAGKPSSPEVWDKETTEPEPAPEVWDKETTEPEPAPEVWDKETTEPEPVTEVSDSETEEPELAGEPSAQEEPHSEAEELSSVIRSPSCSLSQWQPRVSLLTLPVCPPATGRPLPCFGPVLDDAEAEGNLQDLSEDPQSPVGESSPGSPASLLLVSCSACRSASASIICSFCGRGFHRGCHVPPVGPDLWTEWSCSLCQDLSDPVDPFSSQRPGPPPHLRLQDQRRCESLLLLLRVAGGPRLPQSSLSAISERLSSSYRSVSEFKSDVKNLFSALQDDDFTDKLREEVRRRWRGGSRLEEQEVVRQEQEVVRQEQEVVRQEQEVVRQEQEVPGEEQEVNSRASRLSQTRKRLRELLMETARSKRARTDTTEA